MPVVTAPEDAGITVRITSGNVAKASGMWVNKNEVIERLGPPVGCVNFVGTPWAHGGDTSRSSRRNSVEVTSALNIEMMCAFFISFYLMKKMPDKIKTVLTALRLALIGENGVDAVIGNRIAGGRCAARGYIASLFSKIAWSYFSSSKRWISLNSPWDAHTTSPAPS